MRLLEYFKSGEELEAKKLNHLIEQLRIIQNIQADRQSDILVSYTKNGLFIGRTPSVLVVDDKYLLDSPVNISDRVERRCDLKRADIADFFRIRAIPGAEERPRGISKTLPLYHLMQFLNTVAGGEGGWITDAGLGFQYIEKTDKHGIAPPINHVAQWGSVIVLTDDDVEVQTADGDGFTYVNVRHDAHQHMDEDHDGRIYFTRTPPGAESTGLHILGEMVGDPDKANDALSLLKRESVEWRPQQPYPGLEYYVFDWECYEPLNIVLYRFPPVLRIPSSSILGHEFVDGGKPSGYSAHAELHDIVEGQGMGFRIKYSGENLTGLSQNVYFEYEYKVINDGGDLSTAAMVAGSFTIPVPAGNTEQDVIYADVPIVPYSVLLTAGRGCLIIFEFIVRAHANVADTFGNRMPCVEWKPRLMVVPEPPV